MQVGGRCLYTVQKELLQRQTNRNPDYISHSAECAQQTGNKAKRGVALIIGTNRKQDTGIILLKLYIIPSSTFEKRAFIKTCPVSLHRHDRLFLNLTTCSKQ